MLTDKEKDIVRKLNHPIFTVDVLEKWLNRSEESKGIPGQQSFAVTGYYEAVRRMAEVSDKIIYNHKAGGEHMYYGTLGEGKGYPANRPVNFLKD